MSNSYAMADVQALTVYLSKRLRAYEQLCQLPAPHFHGRETSAREFELMSIIADAERMTDFVRALDAETA